VVTETANLVVAETAVLVVTGVARSGVADTAISVVSDMTMVVNRAKVPLQLSKAFKAHLNTKENSARIDSILFTSRPSACWLTC